MGFFDLNIPYTESTKQISTTQKSNRLKLAVKAMELGYTGIAYNRTITGVMSEVDRCSISPFPLSSVLKVSPSASTAVKFHRRLLNVPLSTPFRQYTRLTVVVDTPAQGSALNSGNPVLKTYDIVAIRPLKQESFDQACKNYEVDIIAIDFSENRFRLKQPLIKAAIERGVYFEITCSGLIMDAQLRRQVISNAKLLVGWTRGKNIIFSSAAPSVTEFRGPNDVANMAFLLGFSMERAKAAVSKTCRSLLANALRKKKFYKEAIRVELMSSAEQFDLDEAGSDDWLKWDPISSGEGDLQLDDMAKSFVASGRESKTVKAIDFASIIDELPSHGLHIKDIISETKRISDLPAAAKAEKPVSFFDMPIDSKSHDLPENDKILGMETLEKDCLSNFDNRSISSATENLEALSSVEEAETCPMVIEEDAKKIPNDSNICFSCPQSEQQNPQAEVNEAISETNDGKRRIPTLEKDTRIGNAFDAPIHPPIIELNEASIERNKGDLILSSDASSHEKFHEEHMRDTEDVAVLPGPCVSLNEDVPQEHISVKFKDHSQTNRLYSHESSSERVGRKHRSSHGSVSFPFKRLLKPSHLKKVRKLKNKSTIT